MANHQSHPASRICLRAENWGLVYTITDVLELHDWMCTHFEEHPLFERVPLEDLSEDPIVGHLGTSTEEGKKVLRNGGRISQPSSEEYKIPSSRQ